MGMWAEHNFSVFFFVPLSDNTQYDNPIKTRFQYGQIWRCRRSIHIYLYIWHNWQWHDCHIAGVFPQNQFNDRGWVVTVSDCLTLSVLICNLAIADLLFVLTLPVLSITMFNNTSFIFGETVCQVYTGWMYSSMYNRYVCQFKVNKRFMESKSAFTVAALSVDRFCAVSSPLGMRKYRRKDCAIYVTVFTWIAATLWHGIVIVTQATDQSDQTSH